MRNARSFAENELSVLFAITLDINKDRVNDEFKCESKKI